MRKHGMKRLVLLSLLALLPVLLMVAIYIIRDPFHVIKPYNGSINNTADTVQLTVNTGYFSTEAFKYFEPTRHYDSFIMGSSLSGYYRIQDWVRHLPDSVSAFHFNASRETLIGIRNKLNYLVANGATIKHVLIVMEDEMLKRQPIDQDVLFVQHPQTASNVSWWEFHQLYFNAFRHPELAAYTIWPNATSTRLALEKGYATTDIPDRIEELNEGYYGWADSIIDCNPEAFFTPEHLARYAQPMRLMPCPDKITPTVESLLNDIATILRNQGTDYQIIIPPHYAWEPISSHDLYMLELIFGQQRVHDYSHDPELSTDLHYYYDDGHLIARECARLMDSAYHTVSLPSSFLTQ